ncbi:TetR/AcrR family transcriptional regulator [Chondromyces apiculatus]|uniref:Transcriptional regulator, TetR family n=1 Tax=Chondromyces apiculatus DSM 436 TaxID=1192034 RepID=A0A017TEB2_9BACT|nr:TetR/AcrR family transcriptional regulator [Chondromyces apiculatus]EYF07267.1 transcriptional regulator, TetR family [Chondromyces apiculatus DSM 436]
MARQRNITDEQILEQARACFLEHGAGISTTVIAEQLGISHGVLFQRFGTKEQLLRAALLPSPEQPWLERARSGPDDRDVQTQLRELAMEISAHLERMVPCLAVLRSAGVHVDPGVERPEDLPPVRARREVAAWFERAFTRGLLRPVPAEHAADLFLGALHFRPFHQHLSRQRFEPAENRAYVEFAVEVLCRMFAPEAKTR